MYAIPHSEPDLPGLAAPYASQEEAEVLQVVLAQARSFLGRWVDARVIDTFAELSPSVWHAAAEAGLFGLAIPHAFGGAGLSLKACCRVVEELARVDRSVATTVGLHTGLGTRGLVEYGASALRARYLPALAEGERVAAFAATEASAGSDLTAVRTAGALSGEGLELSGEKSYVTNGGFAGLFTVLARTPGLGGARAFSLVVVPREAPGVEVGPEEVKLGIRGSSTVTVRFEGVYVPMENVLGELGRGMDQAHRCLAWGRTLLSAGCVGTATAALDASRSHVLTRRQFGRPLGDFVAVRGQLVDMTARVYAMTSLVREVGCREAAGQAIDRTSSVAKVFCSETAFAACDLAVQLHGALGFLEPVGVARMLRDCRITRIFEGANDVLLVRAAVALLMSREAPPTKLSPRVVPALGSAARRVDELSARLTAALGETRRAHGVNAVHRQLLLQALARAEVCRAAGEATALRATDAGDDSALGLAARALELLSRDGERHLDDAARAVDDEGAVESLALSAGLSPGTAGGPR